jgi:hypothetical protein
MDFDRFDESPLDPAVRSFRGFTESNERAFNRWYAAETYTGRGEIVDLGCMTGSSTAALASGLAMNPRANGKRVHAFDRFVKTWPTIPGEPLADIPQGGDFYHRFVEDTAPWQDRIQAYRGNLESFPWPGEPIEYLLVDLMKSWDTAQTVTERFFPSILDGDGLVVHQDFLHFFAPWIHLLMFRLRDSLVPAFEVPDSCTMVFRKAGPLDSVRCRQAVDFEGTAPEEVDEAFRWAESIIRRNSKAALRAAKAMFFFHYASYQERTTRSNRVASWWRERAAAEYRSIELRYRPNRDVVNAGKFIDPDGRLFDPKSILANVLPQALTLGTYSGSAARISVSAEGVARVEIDRRPAESAWHVQLMGTPVPVTRGDAYGVSFRARADGPRKTKVIAFESGSGAPLGLAQDVELDAEWREFRFDFMATKSDEAARLRFPLGMSETAVEMADVRFGPWL